MLAYVFPGQGSQVVGMGKDLFDEFKEYVDAADENRHIFAEDSFQR